MIAIRRFSENGKFLREFSTNYHVAVAELKTTKIQKSMKSQTKNVILQSNTQCLNKLTHL